LAVHTVAVIGAGIAGLSLANLLAQHDLDILLIDRAPFPGGRAGSYGCKAADGCVHCGVCLLREAQAELLGNAKIRSLFAHAPGPLRRREDGRFELDLKSLGPLQIDWRRCSGCGRCEEACPTGAITRPAGWSYTIDNSCNECNECNECLKVCPLSAIEPAGNRLVSADCVVVATGFAPYDPTVNRRWGYPAGRRVVTASELETLFFEERFVPDLPEFREQSPADDAAIAFIQCVGSRHLSDGRESCSRVCCAYALRLAGRLKQELPGAAIDFYVMDIQNFGKHFAALWSAAGPKLNIIHSLPVAVGTNPEGRPLVRFEPAGGGACREHAYDLLVLSQGICPAADAAETAELFALSVDAQGFFGFGAEGIFPVGTCRRPMSIEECVEDAFNVSSQVMTYLERRG
jgi:heterodisulfide reductase subunit A-like polyferredoxin